MSGWTAAWLLWLAMFFAIEVPALLDRRSGNTLSEHVWAWAAIRGKPAGWRWRRAVLVMGLAWLAAHLLSGGRF